MRWCKYDFRQHVMIIPKHSAYFQGFLMMFIPRIKDFSRIGWSLENALDLMKKPLQRLLAAIEGAGRRVSAGVLQENTKVNIFSGILKNLVKFRSKIPENSGKSVLKSRPCQCLFWYMQCLSAGWSGRTRGSNRMITPSQCCPIPKYNLQHYSNSQQNLT